MMYFIVGILLILYCELLGRMIFAKFGYKTMVFAFPTGFAVILAFGYVFTSILTALNCSYYLIFAIYSAFFIFSFYEICKKIKEIDFHLGLIDLTVLIFAVIILLYYSSNTTLGDLNGYDSTHYLNLVTGNIGLNKMNFKNPVFNENFGSASYGLLYVFQSYFYMCSCFLGTIQFLLSLLDIEFFASTAFTWIFQMMFHAILVALIINSTRYFFGNNYTICIGTIIIYVFSYGRIYFNSVYGFYGNTLRTLMIALLIFYTIIYLKDKDVFPKTMIYVTLLASCALSSTSVFLTYFYLLALFFIDVENDRDIFKSYSYVLFIPTINLLATTITNNILLDIIISFIFCILLYKLNDVLYKIFSNRKRLLITLIICVCFTLLLSLHAQPDIFNFDSFFMNNSERYDMTLDYFDFKINYGPINIFKLLSLTLLFANLLFSRNDKYIKMIWILILVFFNPFCCKILNELISVYYRAYDLILNPVSIVYFLFLINKMINNKYKVTNVFVCTIAILILINYPVNAITYWHESFVPGDDYNKLYKMNNDEIDVIKNLKYDINYREENNPFILTPNILTQSMIPEGHYIFGREYRINKNWSESEYQLYAMFFPVLYYGDPEQPQDVDYANMCRYIADSNVDYIVQDKRVEYYDEVQNIWYSMTYKIDECGVYPFYENDTYAIYYFGEN